MEIAGLPLHPLVVHAAVVFGPLGALTALLYALVPRGRDRLRWPMLAAALVATGSIVAAYLSGRDFLASRPELTENPQVLLHRDRAELLLWFTLVFAVAAVAAAWLHHRTGAVRWLVGGALAVTATAVLVQAVLTGDAGARAVWETAAALSGY